MATRPGPSVLMQAGSAPTSVLAAAHTAATLGMMHVRVAQLLPLGGEGVRGQEPGVKGRGAGEGCEGWSCVR